MMGTRMPETCWAVFKRQVINLRSCCIWLVNSVESMMMHGLANPKLHHLYYEHGASKLLKTWSVQSDKHREEWTSQRGYGNNERCSSAAPCMQTAQGCFDVLHIWEVAKKRCQERWAVCDRREHVLAKTGVQVEKWVSIFASCVSANS